MPKDLDQKDLNNLMLTWQAALTMAHGQVADFKEAYIEDKANLTPEQIAEWMGNRILSYYNINYTELKEILIKYLDVRIANDNKRIANDNKRIKELH